MATTRSSTTTACSFGSNRFPRCRPTWTQLIPNDINDRGWIVGMGRKGPLLPPAQQEWFAFLLKPPHSM